MTEQKSARVRRRRALPRWIPLHGDCERFTVAVGRGCAEHVGERWACPDAVIVMTEHGWALPIRDGGGSFLAIEFCPFCGRDVAPR